MNIADPSTYFWRLFTPEYYRISHTKGTFHNSDYVKFLSEYEYKDELSIKTCLERDKKIILQMDLHPCTDDDKPFEIIKNKFFDYMLGKKEIIENMQSGKMVMFLYQGWEAENYTISHWPDDKYKTFYHMIEDVLQQYGLPYNSIIILNSNVKLHNYKHKVNVIYDNAMEMNSFKRGVSGTEYGIKIKDFDLTYRVDEAKHKVDMDILNNIDKDIPLTGSPYERKQGYHKLHEHPNSPIPFDVYQDTTFSWVSTSLPDQADKVFLNQSTFNPILHYHPLLWHGQKHTTKWFKNFGYKSYEWLFENESKADDTDSLVERLMLNIQDIVNVMNMSDDELYNRLKDNKDTLQHNRDLLFECKSIERIITKFYETTI
jgi:hypothetical protein